MANPRDRALELIEEGIVSAEDMVTMCVKYMSVDDVCLLYTSPSPRDRTRSRMPSSA